MANTQTLSFPIRLPDAMQAEALRLLEASRRAINDQITQLWPQLDRFAGERTGPAWKQVEQYLVTRSGHGSRQERCEMEQAGRILRAQASRKQVFASIVSLLSLGLIIPAQGKKPARKDHKQIHEQVATLRAQMQGAGEDAEAFVVMTNLMEQACNGYLRTGTFPTTYEELQPVPTLSVGLLPLAGDDGMSAGQAYRARIKVSHVCDLQTQEEHLGASLWVKLRCPDEQGTWVWGEWSDEIALPATVVSYLEQGATPQAPTLREISHTDGRRVVVLDVNLEVATASLTPLDQEGRVVGFDWGVRSLITVSILEKPQGTGPYRQVSRPVFLDTGGLDGRQARLRREIDRLKACHQRYVTLINEAQARQEEQAEPLPLHFAGWQERVRAYDTRITQCWKMYERRNHELAHLASNLLILLALLADCRLICGENLATLKTEGRGRGVRGRFRNWRNTTTVRGELWQVLKYKCHLLGIRARQVEPEGTPHTCPRCHHPAKTYASSAPADRRRAIDWGPWLCCANPVCLWNGARDYAASLNIAGLGMAFLITYHHTKRYCAYRMTSPEVNSCLYSRQEATLLLPSQGITPRPFEGTHVSYAGWSRTTSLRTSQSSTVLAILSTSALRTRTLQQAPTSVA